MTDIDPSPRRGAGLVLATAASGVLYALAFPTAGLQPLAWVALVPFLVAVRRARRLRTAVLLGWLWMLVMGYTVADWLVGGVARYFDQPLAVGVAIFFYVATFMAGLEYMAFAAAYRTLATRPRALVPLLAAAAWVAAEFARANLLTGNPWALLGYSQIGILPLMQIADVTGVYGIGFVIVAVNAALAELWLARDLGAGARRQALAGLGLAGTAVAVVLAYGEASLRLRHLIPDTPEQRVGLVQGNLDVGQQWRAEYYGRNLEAYLRLTDDLLARPDAPAVVFWPENALTFLLADEPRYRTAIGRVLAAGGAELVTGGPRVSSGDPPRYHSSVFLLAPGGDIRATYDKQKLLVFGEYFPLASIDLLRRFARVREFSPGAPSPPLPTAIGPAGVTICNEAMFPEIAAARAREGATYLVDPANDTWLTPKFSAQQFDIVTLRAVEQRRYLVRASTAGPSAIVDPLGRVVTRSAFFTRAALTGTIRPSTYVTPYARLGDAFAWACVAVTALAVARRGRRQPPLAAVERRAA